MMTRSKLATAVGLALTVGTAMQAWALRPDQVPVDTVNGGGNRIGNRLYISGATATDQILGRLLTIPVADGGLCALGSVDVYTAVAPQALPETTVTLGNILGASNKAILCTTSANATNTGAGVPVGLFKESVGGSQNGVDPPALGLNTTAGGAAMNFLNLGSSAVLPVPGCNSPITFTALTASGVTITERFNVHYSCTTAALQQRASHVGVSDLDPPLLTNNADAVSKLTYTPTIGIVFAPAVSLRLYRELQAAQGLESTCGNDNNGFKDGDSTNDCDEAVNVPSLTKAQLRGLYTGAIPTWDLLTNDAGTPLTATPETAYICRRGNTSGTEAAFEVNLLAQRCVQGVVEMISPDVAACATQGNCAWDTPTYLNHKAFAGAGTGDVRNCLIQQDDSAAQHRALGLLSTESTPPNINSNGPDGNNATTADRGWRYVAIERANPDLESVGEGNYDLWTENTWNVPNKSPVDGPSTVLQPAIGRSAIEDTFQQDIQTSLGNQTVIVGLNETFRYATGDGGILGIPGITGTAPTPPFTEATWRTIGKAVNTATRSAAGVNNCAPPMVVGTSTEAGGANAGSKTSNGGADYAP
jgi:hypothetical protein